MLKKISKKRIKFLLLFFFKVKIIFKLPKKNKIILFDSETYNDTKILLKKYKHFILEERLEHFNKFYLNLEVIKYFFSYYKGSVKLAYLSAIIKVVEPKVVITFIHNSINFSELAKVFHPNVNFVAIQNGQSYDIPSISKRIFLPNFFCFSKYQIDFYKKYKVKVINFYPVGSLRLSNFLKQSKNFLKKKNYLFDICFIVDHLIHEFENNIVLKKKKDLGKLTKYIVRFCIKNKLNLITLYKYSRSKQKLIVLQKILKKVLNEKEYNFFLESLKKKFHSNHSSYKTISSSKVLCGYGSTLFLEKVAMGGKIIHCNFSGQKIYDFPDNGICSLKDCSFLLFEKRLKKIFNMSYINYFKGFNKDKNYSIFINKKISTIKLIQEKIDKFIIN